MGVVKIAYKAWREEVSKLTGLYKAQRKPSNT
eukprot:COSAG02_NODE_38988_length_422_cov_0.962848_1_plen_31_part_10